LTSTFSSRAISAIADFLLVTFRKALGQETID